MWQRSYGDVDLVLYTDREQPGKRADLLRFLGDFQGFEYDFIEHHDVTMNGILPVDFSQVWQDSTEIKFRGCLVRVMSPADMLIAACISSCRKRFARLKWFCAVAEIVRSFEDSSWSTFVAKSHAYCCENISYTGLYTAQLGICANLPNGLLEQLSVPPVKRRLIQALGKCLIDSPLSAGRRLPIISRNMGISLLLPYATYSWVQRIQKIREMRGGMSIDPDDLDA